MWRRPRNNSPSPVARTRTKLIAKSADGSATINLTIDRDLCISLTSRRPVWEKIVQSFDDNKGTGVTTTQEVEDT